MTKVAILFYITLGNLWAIGSSVMGQLALPVTLGIVGASILIGLLPVFRNTEAPE